MATVNFRQRFSPSEATRGMYAPINTSTLNQYTTGDSVGVSRGRYATLNYIIGSEPGALNIALSGGTVILPVSTVNINEPLSVENVAGGRLDVTTQTSISTISIPVDTTYYGSLTIPPTSLSAVNFTPNVTLVEVFNTNISVLAYVGFNSVSLNTLSAQGLPILGETYYSIERDTSTVYVGNASTSTPIDVRVIGHRKA